MSAEKYDILTDEQLVLLSQQGESAAADEIISRYAHTARIKAASMSESVALHDVDDLTQEAMIGLLSALYSYRGDRSTGFRTYANVCMNNRLITVANAMRAKRLVPDSVILPLDELNEQADSLPDPEQSVMIGCTADKISGFINTQLSDFESDVLSMFLSGYSYAETGKALHTDEKAVDNAMQRIRRKLRKLMSQ